MKRSGGILAFLTIFSMGLVSAGPVEGVSQLLDGLKDVIYLVIEFIGDTLLEINSFDELLFAKLLLLTIIFLVVYVVISKNDFFGESKAIRRVIAAAIAILAIRFLPTELVEFILLQYSALAVGLTVFIPFIIFLFFLHQSNFGHLPRIMGWAFFAISYFAIWSFRYRTDGGITSYLYWFGILAIAIAFFFDRQIHGQFGELQEREAKRGYNSKRYTDIQARIEDLTTKNTNAALPERVRKGNQKEIIRLGKVLKEINKEL